MSLLCKEKIYVFLKQAKNGEPISRIFGVLDDIENILRFINMENVDPVEFFLLSVFTVRI